MQYSISEILIVNDDYEIHQLVYGAWQYGNVWLSQKYFVAVETSQYDNSRP